MKPQPNIHVGGYRQVVPQQIIRLEADRNYTHIFQADGRKFLVSVTLGIIEERLRPYGFLRITRSDVINPHYIRKISQQGIVQLTDGTLIYSSRRRKKVLPQYA